MFKNTLLSVGFVISAVPVMAQNAPAGPELDRLFEAIRMEESYEILALSGLQDASDLESDMFEGQGTAGWRDVAAQIFEPEVLRSEFDAGFPEDRLSDDELAEVLAFWESDLGQRIVAAEMLAWRAISDPDVEEAANEVYFQFVERSDPRLEMLERFNHVNDFVELNLAGALNSNFAFYRGLSDGGAYGQDIPEDMMLAEIWGQEPEIRESVTLWLYSFQLMAYAELTDAELEAYIAFSETEAGMAYNAAIFAGFDGIFESTSYQLGTAAGYFMSGSPL